MNPYLYFNGLLKLISDVDGTEKIHIGIRPYGFHAGNSMALIVYPYLLCKYFEKLRNIPRFHFIISINDWEQDALDGPDIRKYPFNIYPKNTSLQFLASECNCHRTAIEHWEPIIIKNTYGLKNKFPEINFSFIRNSTLKKNNIFKRLLVETIRNPKRQLDILVKHSNKETLESPLSFAGVVCRQCQKARGETSVVSSGLISWKCKTCLISNIEQIEQFDFWWYHKPMLIARLEIFGVDVTLSGGDHFSEGDFMVRKEFLKTYSPDTKEPKMIFTPIVVAENGEKMSKSRNNMQFANIRGMIDAADGFDSELLTMTNDLTLNNINEKDDSYIF